jgi:hypothetical protein
MCSQERASMSVTNLPLWSAYAHCCQEIAVDLGVGALTDSYHY